MKTNKSTESLSSLVSELELQLGMNVSVNGGSLKGLPLYDFLLVMQKSVKTSDSESLKKYSYHISSFCMKLSYFNDRFAFQNRNVLDFTLYDNADVLCSFFLQYQEHRDIKDFKNRELSTFIEYIKIMEQSNSGLQDTLSYRFIRLFLTLVCMGFHVDASVVCQFLRNQFWVFEGLNPRSKLSNAERTKLMNKVMRDRSKYSRRFKEKMYSSIRKVSKTVTSTPEDAEYEVASEVVDSQDSTNQEPSVQDNEMFNSTNDVDDSKPSDIFENVQEESPSEEPVKKSTFEKPNVNYSSRKIVKTDTEALEKELLEKKKLEEERLEKERQEEQERLERERLEKEKLEKAEKERLEQERIEKQRLEEEEKQRLEFERKEQERLRREQEKEKLKREQLNRLKAQKEKREQERQEQLRKENEEKLKREAEERLNIERRKEEERLALERERKRIEEQKRIALEKQRQAELEKQRQRQLELERQRLMEEKRKQAEELKKQESKRSSNRPKSTPSAGNKVSVEGSRKGLKGSSIF